MPLEGKREWGANAPTAHATVIGEPAAIARFEERAATSSWEGRQAEALDP